MGNRVATYTTIELIPPERWRHVVGTENPADCASRGLYPSELVDHHLWWNGPVWLKDLPSEWPKQPSFASVDCSAELTKEELCHVATTLRKPSCVVCTTQYSSFERLR